MSIASDGRCESHRSVASLNSPSSTWLLHQKPRTSSVMPLFHCTTTCIVGKTESMAEMGRTKFSGPYRLSSRRQYLGSPCLETRSEDARGRRATDRAYRLMMNMGPSVSHFSQGSAGVSGRLMNICM